MKIICVDLNFWEHIEETDSESAFSDGVPVLFLKPDTAILHNDDNRFFIPDFSSDIYYETEVVVKINKMGKNIAERFAHRYYEELTVGIDFTALDVQNDLKRKGLPWDISKAFDNSAAIGNFVSKENFGGKVDCIDFRLKLNGNDVQVGNTNRMIHSIDKIIAYASSFFTLKTGDLIFTGTPAGAGKIAIGDCLTGYIGGCEVLNLEVC